MMGQPLQKAHDLQPVGRRLSPSVIALQRASPYLSGCINASPTSVTTIVLYDRIASFMRFALLHWKAWFTNHNGSPDHAMARYDAQTRLFKRICDISAQMKQAAQPSDAHGRSNDRIWAHVAACGTATWRTLSYATFVFRERSGNSPGIITDDSERLCCGRGTDVAYNSASMTFCLRYLPIFSFLLIFYWHLFTVPAGRNPIKQNFGGPLLIYRRQRAGILLTIGRSRAKKSSFAIYLLRHVDFC